jgi:hypothetical protein
MVVISDCRAMDHVDVLHALCEAVRVEDSIGDNESDTKERLRDGQVKLGEFHFWKPCITSTDLMKTPF